MQMTGASAALRLLAVYLGAIICGALLDWLKVPLPFLIGALLFSMVLSIAGVRLAPPVITRVLGQLTVAASVGLSFTPAAVAVVAAMIVPMVAVAALTIAAGFLASMVLLRLAHMDAVSAMLCSIPIGPVETANLARSYGVPEAPAVFSQTLRIVLLILIIPPVLFWIDGEVGDPTAALREVEWRLNGALLLFASALAGGVLAWLLRLSNPFFLGPLAGSALAAAFSMPITGFPYPFLAGAQVLLGVSLGATFDRTFLAGARGFIPAALVSTLTLIALCTLLGFGLAALTGEHWTVMVLATAPGSITEMALAAKVLQQGVALVTAFHVVRIMIIMPLAPLIFRVANRVAQHFGLGAPPPPRDG